MAGDEGRVSVGITAEFAVQSIGTLRTRMTLPGPRLMARDFDREVAELQVRAVVLNDGTALAIAATEAVGYRRLQKADPRPTPDLRNRVARSRREPFDAERPISNPCMRMTHDPVIGGATGADRRMAAFHPATCECRAKVGARSWILTEAATYRCGNLMINHDNTGSMTLVPSVTDRVCIQRRIATEYMYINILQKELEVTA